MPSFTSLILPLFGALLLAHHSASAALIQPRQAVQTYDCKPGQSCWPTTAQWAAFNTTVGGKLRKTVPLAAPCFIGNPAFSFGQCSAVQQSYTDATTRANIYGAAQAIQYEACGDANCQLISLAPELPPVFSQCSLGRLAAYYVDATTAADVSATLAFVRTHNIRLSIKNTGHDYLGRSMAPNSLALWTHNIQTLRFHQTFTPNNCPAAGTLTGIGEIGAGVLAGQAVAFFGSQGVDVTLGNAGTVGVAGGFGQSAGHGVFGPSYGLMVDQAVEFDVVTADGVAKTVNQCNDPDLFWAMRGGGGGTFAVLTAYRFKTYPRKSIHTYQFQASFSLLGEGIFNRPVLRALLNAHISNSTQFSANSVTGRFYYGVNLVDFLVTLPSNEGDVRFKELTARFRAGITSIPGLTVERDEYVSYATYADYDTFAQERAEVLTPTGFAANVASRLIPRPFLSDPAQQAQLAEATLRGIETASGLISIIRGMPVLLVLMTTPINTPDPNRQTSAHPAWRDAVWHATYLGGWIKGFPISAQQDVIRTVNSAAEPLRALTPGGGSYFNEDSILVENWQQTFFGDNYARLLQVKNQYDPTHLFDCWKCVGWRGAQDPGYSCYGPNPTGPTIPA